MTIVDLEKSSSLTRKTIQKIDKGEEVKSSTIYKLANALGVSFENLSQRSEQGEIDRSEEGYGSEIIIDLYSSSTATARPFDPELDDVRLSNAAEIRFALQLSRSEIAEPIETALRELNNAIQTIRAERPNDKSFNVSDDLEGLLVEVKSLNRLDAAVDSLEELGVAVYICSYAYWECTDEFYLRTERYYSYSPKIVLVIGLAKKFGKEVRCRIDSGTEPPIGEDEEGREDGVEYFVNGRKF